MKLVLATHNKDKVTELRASLKNLNIQILTLEQFPEIGDIEETGATLSANAKIKAEEVYKITQIPSIADDTGLEVEALGGAPGVYSSRFAGENVSYDDNVNKLLKEMEEVPPEGRSAKFRTVICFVDGKRELYTQGEIKGIIAKDKRGDKGFGYDPIFYIPQLKKTMAELTTEEKNKISHRGNAIRNLRKLLKELIQKTPN